MDREGRQWRRLALMAAATCGLLIVRVLQGRALLAAPDPAAPVVIDEDELFTETMAQKVMRRLGACEAHLTDIEERLAPRQGGG